jgi:hypothetical protein
MTPVELEAALDQVLRGDQGAAQRIIDHNKRLELINTDYELGKHADAQQVATLTAQLATVKQERDDLRKDRDDAVDMREGSLMRVDGLQQQLAQAQARLDVILNFPDAIAVEQVAENFVRNHSVHETIQSEGFKARLAEVIRRARVDGQLAEARHAVVRDLAERAGKETL